MDNIRITENHEEMKAIAREIIEEKKSYYSDRVMDMIRDFITGRLPDISDEELEDMALISVYHYWVYGCTTEEFMNYDFMNKTHEEKKTYMTLRVRLLYMAHLSKKEDAHLLFNKYEAYQIFKDEFMREVILCSSEEDFPVFYDFTRRHPEFVVKPTDMSGARGVHKADVIGLSDEEVKKFFIDMLAETEMNHEKFRTGTESSVVVEELIDQDESLAVFNPASVNGIRLPTVKVDGKVHIYQPWFKIGVGGNFITSSVYGTLLAGIDAETGIVDTPGTPEVGKAWDFHPDTGLQITGFQIPRWKELCEFATECALKLPTIGYVGWDFALSKKGWCVMEGNYSGDFMWQVYRHRGMKKDFEDLIGWKLDKEFWWQ
ncbi:MAG: hypothetical protein IKI78_04715 [Clostridia bacterium]|nr:hypothetical protein [Clostridia bacterium]